MENDLTLDFHTPYSLKNKILRFVWNVCWTIFARPFPKSIGNNWKNAMPVKSFEAILTLTPIIASKNTVLGDFVEKNDIGFTIDIHKENDLQNLLNEVVLNPKMLEEKVKKLKEIQYLYIWENVVINLDKIYKGEEK